MTKSIPELTNAQVITGMQLDELQQYTGSDIIYFEEPDLTEDPSLLTGIVGAVEKIMGTVAPAYKPSTCKSRIITSHWYRVLRPNLQQLFLAPYQKYDCCTEIRAFFRAAEQVGLHADMLYLPLHAIVSKVDEPVMTLAEKINLFLDAIRREMKSPWAIDLIRQRRKRSKDQLDSAINYVNYLFECRARLLIIRVDLLYLKDYAETLTFGQFNADLHRLADNQRNNRIFRNVLGSITKLEHGVNSGFHAHCIFFIDGSVQQNDKFIAQQIGEYWVNNITRGNGRFENCNRSVNRYRNSCIGQIEYDDLVKRKTLETCLKYFTKCEQYLIFKPFSSANTRTLRRSHILKRSGSKKGCKRKALKKVKPAQCTRRIRSGKP